MTKYWKESEHISKLGQVGRVAYEMLITNPFPRGAVYATLYIANHNDIPACIATTAGIVTLESILSSFKLIKEETKF